MNRLTKGLSLILISFFFFQCQKDTSYVGGVDFGSASLVLPDPIKANLQGNVVDENNLPAAGVTITNGTSTTTTDATGYFRFTDAALDKNTSVVTAEKGGYFKSYRVFAATPGTNQVMIKLVKREVAATIAASAGSSATLPNGAQITLPANGVVVASTGNIYTGDIKVYASYIDPDGSDIDETVPGSFVGNDKTGNRVTLASYGMLAVELEATSGEKLQIKTGAVATLTTPIAATAASSAPATIPMWYLNEQTGIWTEEGSATKQGNNYVGDVKHFSYWNCDFPYEGVSLSMTLHNANGLPLVHASVRVSPVGLRGSAHGFTDSLGQAKGLVPKNKSLLIQVLDPCGNVIYSQNLSPLTQSTDLGTITVTSTSPSLLTLQGTLLDCSGAPVKTGYAIISYNNQIRYASTNASGQFAISYLGCNTLATAKIIGVNQGAQQQGTATVVNVVSPVTNVGNISACGTSSAQYLNYTLDGTDYSITSAANDSLTVFSTTQGNTKTINISGLQKAASSNHLNLVVNNVTGSGTFPMQSMLLQSFNSIILTQPFNVTFTSFANAGGEYYEGSFTGKFTADNLTAVHNINGRFRIRRS